MSDWGLILTPVISLATAVVALWARQAASDNGGKVSALDGRLATFEDKLDKRLDRLEGKMDEHWGRLERRLDEHIRDHGLRPPP